MATHLVLYAVTRRSRTPVGSVLANDPDAAAKLTLRKTQLLSDAARSGAVDPSFEVVTEKDGKPVVKAPEGEKGP